MRGIFAFVLSALIAVPVFAQSSASLKAANQARSSAMAAGNSKGWARYTTDDFTLTDATGKVRTKQDRVAEIEGHAATGQRTPPTDEKWRSYGPSTAVYTARITGADSTPQRITTTWVKQGRTWKVAAVQLTNVAAAPSP